MPQYHDTYKAQKEEVGLANEMTFFLLRPCCGGVPAVPTFVRLMGRKSSGKVLTPNKDDCVFCKARGAICACLSGQIVQAFLGAGEGLVHSEGSVLSLCQASDNSVLTMSTSDKPFKVRAVKREGAKGKARLKTRARCHI